MKPSRSKDKPVDPTRTQEDDRELVTDAASEAPLTPEERARLLAELEAELEAAERSIEEEGTISAEELKRHLDAKFEAWAREEATAKDKRG